MELKLCPRAAYIGYPHKSANVLNSSGFLRVGSIACCFEGLNCLVEFLCIGRVDEELLAIERVANVIGLSANKSVTNPGHYWTGRRQHRKR